MPRRHGAHCGLSSGISAGRGARRASNSRGGLRRMLRQADRDVAAAGTNPSGGLRRGACWLPGCARRPSAKHSPASQMRHVPFARPVVFLDLPSPIHLTIEPLTKPFAFAVGSSSIVEPSSAMTPASPTPADRAEAATEAGSFRQLAIRMSVKRRPFPNRSRPGAAILKKPASDRRTLGGLTQFVASRSLMARK